ncbi:hypothetical protein HZB88_04880, partial [archaeon]|nr:hypothetical protein [archaeon]
MKGMPLIAVVIALCIVSYILALYASGDTNYNNSSLRNTGQLEVRFLISPEWNISNAIARISQGGFFEDLSVGQFIVNDEIVIDLELLNLNNISLYADKTYIDLIADGLIVDTKVIENRVNEIKNEEQFVDQGSNEVALTLNYETANFIETASAYPGWYNPSANSAGVMQVDYIDIVPGFADTNTQLSCENGSLSNDVGILYFKWYVNDAVVQDWTNASSARNFSGTNFNAGQEVYCQVMPSPNNGSANGTAADSRNRLIVLTSDAHFNNGTFFQTKAVGTGTEANITLSNASGTAYNSNGHWNSSVIDLGNSSNALTLSWGSALAETGTSNVSLQIR